MSIKRPHVFLICVDALRADVFREGAPVWNGVGRPRTPNLDRLSDESIRWPAWASSSWTKPSVPSMLLSMHPSEHGVLEVDVSESGASSASLPDDVPTLAELMADAGYRTVGLAHNAQLDPGLGFDRGYDTFTCDGGSVHAIVDRLLTLAPWRRGPAFVHLHIMEPHCPFGATIQGRAQPLMKGRFAFHRMRATDWKELKTMLKQGTMTLTTEESVFLRQVYRLAVEEADRGLGSLLDELRSQGILEESVVVFTADHGEELLDRGVVGHGQSLHEELTRVPLWIRLGHDVERSEVTGTDGRALGAGDTPLTPAGHVDLVPTIARVAGIRLTHLVAGRSLLDEAPAPFVFSEVKHKRRYHQSVTDGRFKRIRSFRFEKLNDGSGETGRDKNNLAELFEGRPYREERVLFDLIADPEERTDISGTHPEEVTRLDAALDRWWEGRSLRDRDTRSLENEMIRRLEALGYL